MFGSRPGNLGLTRKIIACYLLFCLVAVSWLTAGVLVTSHTVLRSTTVNACLSRLGKTAAAVEIELLRNGEENLEELLERSRAEADLAYCSIVAHDGTVLAHTESQRRGAPADEPQGSLLKWGEVTGVRFIDSRGRIMREYRVDLVTDEAPVGSLRIGVVEPSVWGTLAQTAHVAPFAVLVPLALVGFGAMALSRLADPVAQIESQLRRAALQSAEDEPELEPISQRNAASIGWNRVADLVNRARDESDGAHLSDRLANAIASRQNNDLAEIMQNLPDGVAATDMEGRITFANRAIAALLGAENEGNGLEGTRMEEFLTDEMPELAASGLFDRQSANRSVVYESERAGGASTRVLRVARQPLQGERLKRQVWCLRDVTQQKLAEKMRDQFIDMATHELRTPLTNIKAYAETLAVSQNVSLEQQKEFCNTINSEVTRLARFVDDLLSISSIEAGSLSIDRQPVEAARLFQEVVSNAQPLMQQGEIEFEVSLPEKMGELQLDKAKIVAVLVNLLGNAAKYTPAGGRVSLKVTVHQEQLRIVVEDTGVGIAAEEAPKVFNKFFRSADQRVQSIPGTGLGLSLARAVVRLHDGDITVESQLDQGSAFTVAIPLK